MVRLSLFCLLLLLLVPAILAKECGHQPPEERIFGGDDAYENEFPWQVSWRFFNPTTSHHQHICGGSIISDDWVLTAAHCVDLFGDVTKIKPEIFRAMLGAYRQSEPSVNQKIIEIEKIIVHPLWNYREMNNDIALVKLKQPIGLDSSALNAICLGSPADNIEGGPAIISGWGDTESIINPKPDVLKRANVTIEKQIDCKLAYSLTNLTIKNSQICAGRKKSSCFGDSGGPLQYLKNGKFYQAGITSAGKKCGSPQYPVIFTRVSYYLEFITEHTGVTSA